MPRAGMIKSIIMEYGLGWAVNRTLYNLKLKLMSIFPSTEKWFEKRTSYPKRLDIFQIDVDALKRFLASELSEGDKKSLKDAADKICNGVITGFSSIELDYGDPIDWQFNPLTGKRCDEKIKWYKIPDFEADRGDIKVIWEASRFSHFLTLSRAYLLTGNEKYYKAFNSQLQSWLEKNPYSFGANFKCSQECSLRMVNALLTYSVFEALGVTTDEDAGRVKELVDRCYRKILSNFFYAYKCIKNNHTISELMGMIVGAWCCEDRKRLRKAYKLLNKVINEQFTDDGGYRQFSFNYQRLVLQDLEIVLSISSRTGMGLRNDVTCKILNSALLMYQCQDETGDVPNYGNNDGALVFPITSCGYRDYRPILNSIYAMITGKQLYEGGIHQEELLWFSSSKKLKDYTIEKPDRRSSQFPDAGLFTIRGKSSWAMIVSNEYTSRPAHMDQLHFDLWVDGVNVLCDSGTYSYASDEGRKLLQNESHNTVVSDGRIQMNISGPFMIYKWTKRTLNKADSSSFEAKMLSANGYSHLRSIVQTGASYEITDYVDTPFMIMFHTPCTVTLDNGTAVLSYDGKTLCYIQSNEKFVVQDSYRSVFYLKKETSSCIVIHGQAGTTIKTKINIIERG